MTPQAHATTTFELEIALTGTIQPAERMTRDYPGCDAHVEDSAIEAAGIVQRVREPGSPPFGGRFQWKTTSILEGVNVSSPDIQKLFENILTVVGDDVDQALLGAADERDNRRWA